MGSISSCIVNNKLNIIPGSVYGMLTVIKEVDRLVLPSGQKNRAVLCRCDCGNEKVVRLLHLTRGRAVSCGCKFMVRNGESNSRIYKRYIAMIRRCTEPSDNNYHIYGARGIRVCKEWLNDFNAYKKWAFNNGYRDDLRIDRIDNNGNYEPSNCRFVTNIENSNNRNCTFRVVYNGIEQPFMLLCRGLNIPDVHIPSIRSRISRGWDHTAAIDTPIRKGDYYKRWQ